jgi:uncharacterized OB-fold protein
VSEANTPTVEDTGPVRFMQQLVSLDYKIRTAPVTVRFTEQLNKGLITGHKCPQCGLVYVPPKGFCPICVVTTDERNEVQVADKGTVTSFTVLTPIQYYGQQEREEYALASILLDGADGTVGQQRLTDVDLAKVRMGMRVEAVWAPEDERGAGDARGYGFGSAIQGWRPTDEPDVEQSHYAEHVL